ncbi:hypothetical protein ACYFX5_26815 [Bremerella sp. T1]|uniref:hypothetical protein n=1 Tax=Bremerella sp. TYQ1 TaxID=3119568 RepID=UPI001CCF1953|nr:hypothetical protein [Bremerella volcania]UBM36622.1 hypothetical protein LA756_01670 [Bremerella volcania]
MILNVDLVEKFQRAVAKSKSIEDHIAKLTSATLPGLVEYGCLRFQYPDLPAVPRPIYSSKLGLALAKIRSPLGLRAHGDQEPSPSTITAQDFEFIALNSNDDMTGSRWLEFGARFAFSIVQAGFHRKKALEIAAAMGEMADNAVCHSRSRHGILVGYQTTNDSAVCIIADVGIGVLKSLKTNSRYKNLTLHVDAIETALKDGESRYGFGHGGTGFSTVFKNMAEANGTLRFRSGEGAISIDGKSNHFDKIIKHSVTFRPGFQVTLSCRSFESSQEQLL